MDSAPAIIAVPYHLDEHLSGLALPVRPDAICAPTLPTGGSPWARMAELYESVAAAVATAVSAGGRPVVVSGDCTTSLGIVAGLQRSLDTDGGLGIVWFDAHGDIHTPATTASGYLGGMPLRMLLGDGDRTVLDRVGLAGVPPERAVLVDARDLDPPEEAYLAEGRLRRLPVGDVTADRLPPGKLYLHLDLDVVNSDYLPGLRFPASGGPAPQAVANALRAVLDTGRVRAAGIGCTWYPDGTEAASVAVPLLNEIVTALAGTR